MEYIGLFSVVPVFLVGILVLMLLYFISTRNQEIMEDTNKTGAGDFFLNIFSVVLLYTFIVAYISLFFQYINVLVPDFEQNWYAISSTLDIIRISSSILFVIVPVYIILSWFNGRKLRAQPEKRYSRISRWLSYLTLFLLGITIIVDLIMLVGGFYNGDLTSRFIYKVIVVLVVNAAVFAYLRWDMMRSDVNSKLPKIVAWVVGIVVLATLLWGFTIVGSPATQRARKMDQTRVEYLVSIQHQLQSYFYTYGKLPDSLPVQSSVFDSYSFTLPVDPTTRQPFEYYKKSETEYELCATFEASGLVVDGKSVGMYYGGIDSEYWQHDKGRKCFPQKVESNMNVPPPMPVPVPLYRN